VKPPATVVVGPHTYDVNLVDSISDTLIGDTDCVTLTIRVQAGMPESVTAEVVLHELLHAVWDLTPLRDFDHAVEESVVSALAPPLLDVLRRNPKLVALLVP
jgi:hypothetical protein